MKEFKGIWIPYEVLVDKNLNDKEKMIYSMILSLSYVNASKQVSDEPINKYVKDIINNKIYNKDNCRLKNGRSENR